MSAQGDVVNSNNSKRAVCLLAGVAAPNGQPSLATDGVPVYPVNTVLGSDTGVSPNTRPARESTLFAKVVGSGGTVSATLRLWGYHKDLGEWVPIGTGADTTKGVLNSGSAIGATKTNKALHCEPLLLAGHFDRLYVEVTAISGTTATAEVWINTALYVAF